MAQFILKDNRGKENTFDHETIFVRGVDGELMPFTHGTGNPVLEELEVTENGNYTPSEGVDGFCSVSVNVPDIPAVVQPLEVTENGTYTAPDGVDGYSPVTVNVPTPEIVLQDKTITENGEYTADAGFDGLGKVLVEIASGGGGSLVCKTGQFTASAVTQVVQHNLGVVPSVFLIRNKYGSMGNDNELAFAFGISQELATKANITADQQYEFYTYSNSPRQGTPDYPIDTSTTGVSPLSKANANTISVGYSYVKLLSKEIYTWIAIGITE